MQSLTSVLTGVHTLTLFYGQHRGSTKAGRVLLSGGCRGMEPESRAACVFAALAEHSCSLHESESVGKCKSWRLRARLCVCVCVSCLYCGSAGVCFLPCVN